MKKNMKLKVTALVAMLFMAIAVTFLSFSHADEEIQDDSLLMADASTAVDVGSKTNIDYIIMNSNSTDPEVDQNYNIVEIYSDTASNLEQFVNTNSQFEQFVINAYRTTKGKDDDKLFNPGKVNYVSYYVKDISNDDEEKLKIISNADLIYVNQGKKPFSESNDLCEELYNILHTYAVGDYKPIIINSESKSGSNDDSSTTSETLASLTSDVFSSGIYYYTFAWDTDKQSVEEFLTHNKGSMYLGINGTKQNSKGKWLSLEDADGNKKNMSKFLVVSSTGTSASDGKMYPKLIPASIAEFTTKGFHLTGETEDYKAPDGSKLYDVRVNSNVITSSIYNAKYVTPDVVQVEQCALDKIEDGTYDLAAYDFVLLDESLAGGTEISRDLYNKLAGAMYGGVSVVYHSSLGDSSISTNSGTVSDFSSYNYKELYYMVATTDNLSRYDNVMVTSTNQFNIMTAGNETGAGGIAELINKSTYRGIGGKGSSSNMFTVLEIQPCYPIDLTVANDSNHNGSYYTIPANVINDVDKNTLPKDANGNITVEYYDWELTKAKVAEAVGIDPNKINIVHMSTEELAASKEPILGTYDLIYVGGNRTALKSAGDWRSVSGLMRYAGGVGNHVSADNLPYLPIFTMYSHNGDMVNVSVKQLGESGGDVKGGNPMAEVNIGGYKDSFALLNGNDISYNRLDELKKYVEAGMPVIIEDDVSKAYDAMISCANNEEAKKSLMMSMWNGLDYNTKNTMASTIGKAAWEIEDFNSNPRVILDENAVYQLMESQLDIYDLEFLQNSIDPGCNMRKFLDVCYSKKSDSDGNTSSGKNPVLWGLSNTSNDVSFGDFASVKNLISTSNKRPKLTITSMPVVYNYYDSTTRLSEGKLNFAFEVSGSADYDTILLVDDNGDNTYETEMNSDVTKNSLKCALPDSYFGPISWMLQVKDKKSGLTAYVKGVSYIKNKNNKKQTVRVLQIMPGAASVDSDGKTVASVGEGAQGSNSLYFCPICQNTYERLEYNAYANTNSHFSMWYDGTGAYYESTKDKSSEVYLGKHEHIFGIPKYDSNLSASGYKGIDDWSTNLADDVSDLYDFDLDILLRSEFEDISQEIYDTYHTDGATMTEAINSFTIDASDSDYGEWSLCTTDADKYKFILKRQFSQQASAAYNNYMSAKSDTEATIPDLEAAMDVVIADNTYGYAEDLRKVKITKRYPDIFNAISEGSDRFNDNFDNNALTTALANEYYKYRDKKDLEISYHDEYKRLNRLAHPENWLEGCYDMVIVGPSDDFAGDDITNAVAIADLKGYIEDDGSVLLFHDTLTAARDNGSSTLTSNLRSYFGMDRNRGLTANNPKEGIYYLPYTSTDSNRYFMTNLSYRKATDDTRYASWVKDIQKPFGNFNTTKYLTNVVYTDTFIAADDDNNPGSSPYVYADNSWSTASFYYRDAKNNAKDNKHYGTDKASQNNKGIITQYPFTLSDSLNISGTHAQAYALELDSSKMTVWYSLAGGNNAKQETDTKASASSMYAASRNDGMDNYFIYSYGNVNYCGAGHSKITGLGKDNNDERRLYINIIVNSVKPSVNQPSIIVYDYKTEDKMDKDGSDYIMEVKDVDAWPEFSFKVNIDTSEAGNKLERVRIYYDLDYLITGNDAYVNDKYHIIIADMTQDKDGNPLSSGTIYDVGKDIAALQLKAEYFEPYNQEYTYIVIEATDSSGKPVYQRIKIKLLPYLFEMTQNNINHVIDMIDKI